MAFAGAAMPTVARAATPRPARIRLRMVPPVDGPGGGADAPSGVKAEFALHPSLPLGPRIRMRWNLGEGRQSTDRMLGAVRRGRPTAPRWRSRAPPRAARR